MRDNLFRNRNFLFLWAGESVSLLGAQITVLALPITAVRLLHATALQMGYLQAAQFAPFLFVTVFAGVLVDRYRQRPILTVANLGSAALLAMVPLAALTGRLNMPLLYGISALSGVLAVFLNLSFTSFLPSLVDNHELVSANAKLELSRNGAQMIGPALAATLLSIISAPIALTFNSLSFLFGALGVALVRTREQPKAVSTGRHMWREIADGLHAVFGNVYLRSMVIVAASFNFFFQALATLFVLYAARELAMSNAQIGLVFTAESVGGLIGASLAGMAARAMGFGPSLMLVTFFGCTGLLLVPMAPKDSAALLPMCCAGYFLMGFGITAFNVQTITLRQMLAPAHMLGRVNASARALVFGAIPLGALIAGAAAQHLGTHAAIYCGALGLVVTWLGFAASPIRTVRAAPAAAT